MWAGVAHKQAAATEKALSLGGISLASKGLKKGIRWELGHNNYSGGSFYKENEGHSLTPMKFGVGSTDVITVAVFPTFVIQFCGTVVVKHFYESLC